MAKTSGVSALPTVRELRERTGMLATELAKEANVSIVTLYRIENGVQVGRPYLYRVLNVLSRKLGREITPEDIEQPEK